MSEKKLLNCPFCGGEAEICDGCIEEFLKTEHMKYVQCNYCKASTKLYFTEKEANKAWNTRKPMERILEKLDKRIEHHVKLVNYEMNMGTIVDVERHEEAIKATDKAIEIVKEEGGCE